jgi:alpha-beta hydrolase superfamily lysophospholipase
MKTRAGTVGRGGVAATLLRARAKLPDLPIHLVGHSFGARLVTATASCLPPQGGPATLTLLQGAFSHNGLSSKFDGQHDGAFRTVLADRRVSGPVVITHTKNDLAVGVAYPLASRIARDAAAGLGDKDDPYGGMGRNGAQHTPEVAASETELRELGNVGTYAFGGGKVFNLNGDRFIKDHGDVTGPQVANAFAQALMALQA